MKKTLFVAAALTSGFAWQASQAATIILTNGNFNAATGAGQTSATGWTVQAGTGTNSPPSNYFDSTIQQTSLSSYSTIAFLKTDGNNYIQQGLTTSDAGPVDATTFGTYTVNFNLGYRCDGGTNGTLSIRVALWDTTANTQLASQDFTIAAPTGTTDSLAPQVANLSYDNTAGSLSGHTVALRVINTGADLGANAWGCTGMVDNFLVTAVPEPSAIVALLGGTGILLGMHRRRLTA
jgi:hypothetical protein